MENQEYIKKTWQKPFVNSLNIKKDTFAGTGNASEKSGGKGPKSKKP